MTKHLCLNVRSAHESGFENHPQEIIVKLGIEYQYSTPQIIADQWWFWNCENVPEELPSFLKILNADPMEMIGYGLSKEGAEKIRDYKKDEL